ncbi:response regulator [Vreelandella alkaliphila]|uniref:Response regulator n=1 Tax=Vreelandella alkaliphila TaxID=272774 RepID=A0A7C9JWG9_9GAMM|nr:response regulator [Halomonas alkaliphila]NDL70418.1 response regulator [Halomonas alkaliphila]
MQRYRREHFWNAIVWPILWPLLLVQAALVLLCVLVGLVIWGLSPNQTSWSTTLWLTLALLLGSCLNVGVFLMLVKSRAKQKDASFMQELAELERHAVSLEKVSLEKNSLEHAKLIDHKRLDMKRTKIKPSLTNEAPIENDEASLPLERLANVNQRLVELISLEEETQRMQVTAEPAKPDQALIDDLHHQQKQLKHLLAGRDRAREESRLKSGYLTVLQREADTLFDYLGNMLHAGDSDSEVTYQDITYVRDRLADIQALLTNFVQQSANETDAYEYTMPTVQRQLRILVVDDGPVNLMLARQMLETQGLRVEGVSSGEQALERQQSTFYDLVFMDIFMPTLDGLETARRWRSYERLSGKTRSVLIALTANVDSSGQDIYQAAGMDDMLPKPYSPETLVNMITKWVPAAKGEANSQ